MAKQIYARGRYKNAPMLIANIITKVCNQKHIFLSATSEFFEKI